MTGRRRGRPPRVVLGCNGVRDANAGMAGTVLQVGEGYSRAGWDVSYSFARRPGRLTRQMAYARVARDVAATGADLAVISSGDGLLVPLSPGRTPLIMHSHVLEHRHRRALTSSGSDGEQFGLGHRVLREPIVAHVARAADALCVKTSAEREFAVTTLRCRPERVVVIPNGVEDAFLCASRAPDVDPRIVWVGSWVPRKGTVDLPLVLAEVAAAVPTVTLHLVGTGRTATEVAADFPGALQANVRVTPRTDRAGVRAALAAAWVGLGTSRLEGFGKFVIEYLDCGLPAVVTTAGVGGDLTLYGNDGAVVDPADVRATASHLVRLLQHGPVEADRTLVGRYRWPGCGSNGGTWPDSAGTSSREVTIMGFRVRGPEGSGSGGGAMPPIEDASWYRYGAIVRQLPWTYRVLAWYARKMEASGRRAVAVWRGWIALGAARAAVGRTSRRVLAVGDRMLACDLRDTRLPHVFWEVSGRDVKGRLLTALLEPGDAFVDLGANHGGYSLVAAERVGPAGAVVAVEANARLARQVEDSFARNGTSWGLVVPAAVGTQDAQVLHVPRRHPGSASVSGAVAAPWGRVAPQPVRGISLDSVLERVAGRDGAVVLKVDIEGAELDAIDSGRRMLAALRQPTLLLEVNAVAAQAAGNAMDQVLDVLHDVGYRAALELDGYPRLAAPSALRDLDCARFRDVVCCRDADVAEQVRAAVLASS